MGWNSLWSNFRQHLGRQHFSNRMPHYVFADCDFSPPCPAQVGAIILSVLYAPPAGPRGLSEWVPRTFVVKWAHTIIMKYHVRIQLLSNCAHAQHSEFQPIAEVSFPVLVSPASAKEMKLISILPWTNWLQSCVYMSSFQTQVDDEFSKN